MVASAGYNYCRVGIHQMYKHSRKSQLTFGTGITIIKYIHILYFCRVITGFRVKLCWLLREKFK